MNVICGVNGETWQQVELFLCHHCGMPVCAKDGVTIGARALPSAFSRDGGRQPPDGRGDQAGDGIRARSRPGIRTRP